MSLLVSPKILPDSTLSSNPENAQTSSEISKATNLEKKINASELKPKGRPISEKLVVDFTQKATLERARSCGFDGDSLDLAKRHLKIVELGVEEFISGNVISQSEIIYSSVGFKLVDYAATFQKLFSKKESITWRLMPITFCSIYLSLILERTTFSRLFEIPQLTLIQHANVNNDEQLLQMLAILFKKNLTKKVLLDLCRYPEFIVQMIDDKIDLELFDDEVMRHLMKCHQIENILRVLITAGYELKLNDVIFILDYFKDANFLKVLGLTDIIKENATEEFVNVALFAYLENFGYVRCTKRKLKNALAVGADVNAIVEGIPLLHHIFLAETNNPRELNRFNPIKKSGFLYLLKNSHVNLHILDSSGENILHKLSKAKYTPEYLSSLVSILRHLRIDINVLNSEGNSPLDLALISNNLVLYKELLDDYRLVVKPEILEKAAELLDDKKPYSY